jgi:hypothetical protein
MKPPCPITGQPLRQGQTISYAAAQQLKNELKHVPKLCNMLLDDAATPNPTGNPGTRHPTTPTNPRLAPIEHRHQVTTQTINAATRYAKHLNHRHPGTRSIHTAILLLTTNPNTFTRWDQAPDTCQQLLETITTAWHYLDRPTPTTWIGPCPNCGTQNYATTNTTQCECGTQINPDHTRELMLNKLTKLWLPLDQATQAHQTLTGKPITHVAIVKRAQRHQIKTRLNTDTGILEYSIQDLTKGQTK